MKGIAYQDVTKQCTFTSSRPLVQDLDTIMRPAYDLFPVEYYRLIRYPNCEKNDFVFPMLSGRGCPFKCNFCYRMDKGFRGRPIESIIDEIKFLYETYKINYIVFTDELLMASIDRTMSLCNAMLAADLKIKWSCNGRLNYATPDVLTLMKRAGAN